MEQLRIKQPTGNLYVVSDSHIDDHSISSQEFCDMLLKLPSPNTIVCLGDLFKIWLMHTKFWSQMNNEVMNTFRALQQKRVKTIFVTGNREFFFPRQSVDRLKNFPFDHMTSDKCYIKWGNHKYGFIHGDTINQNDLNYLRWRKIAHSQIFDWLTYCIPGTIARWTANYVESIMTQTNLSYKSYFPEEDVKQFGFQVLNDVLYFFVGHFHIDKKIEIPGYPGKLIFVPDWLSQKKVLQININGEITTLSF